MHKILSVIVLDEDSPIKQGKFSAENGIIEIDTHLDYYIVSCGKALISVEHAIKSATLSLQLLDSDSLNKIALTDEQKSELIQLWVENSIIRVQSIYDRTLIFVNRVLDLGIANESISHNTIVCNEHVKRFSVEKPIKSINKKCNEYRLIRNTVIHHDRYSEDALNNLTMLLSANHLSKETGRDEIVDQKVIDTMIEHYLSAKRSDLTAYLDEIVIKVTDLYDNLIPIYQRKKIELGV